MRLIPFIVIFILAWLEITIFIEIAHVLGVLATMLLVIVSSCAGISLVKQQGIKNFMLLQQKLAAGESPAAEMVKSVSLILAGILLLLPGFFTDAVGLLLLLPSVQKHLTLKLMRHLRMWRSSQADKGFTVDGEYGRKDVKQIEHDHHRDDR
ncbi:FxsA family protein [Erwinia tracheiphila]|uniref:FxsA family protein n=1 Tax=Erwinia tracheiphila TaxID=65700 RepID=A0A345CVF5_9GAMM|nr:FxsA family protein [Erwinia tracheiphila]AXF77422.1 FxsA family protein [Erwinia tracheiphila]UIA83884.1 FxsA family protein [Erwinia tracheiphila]UIA92466.1 FxsA family protein [Erwinia tracheiphila]